MFRTYVARHTNSQLKRVYPMEKWITAFAFWTKKRSHTITWTYVGILT
jgi:hypothetical protein